MTNERKLDWDEETRNTRVEVICIYNANDFTALPIHLFREAMTSSLSSAIIDLKFDSVLPPHLLRRPTWHKILQELK